MAAIDNNYDVILIGSGIGALTVASLMAQLRGKRVLLLERHWVAGGYTHTFERKGFHWDPGLHYVGQMEPGTFPRKLFDLVTRRQVDWQRMPEPFEKFRYPDFNFDAYGDPQQFQADLMRRFPPEASGIRQYFQDLGKAQAALFLYAAAQNSAWIFKLLKVMAKVWHRMDLSLTTQAYLDRHFQDPALKALLASQWLDYGLPPEKSPFAVHATIVSHYLNGGYYPVGGSGKIAQSVQGIVEEHGGQVLLNREVTEVLLDQGRAVGVRARNLRKRNQVEDYYAPVVVSNAGAYNTYCKIIPKQYPIPFRDSLTQFLQNHPPATNVSLFIGFAASPRQLGFRGANHWLYESYDHNAIHASKGEWTEQGQPLQAYLSFPSLKDPEATKHTAEVIAIANYGSFAQWRDQPWRRRGQGYINFKERIRTGILGMIERHYPGFSDLIDHCEVATPVTNEHFTAHPLGGIYGMPMVPERFTPENQPWTRVKTPVPGLYMTGSDVYMLGIMGALLGGLLTLSQLPDGVSLFQVFKDTTKAH